MKRGDFVRYLARCQRGDCLRFHELFGRVERLEGISALVAWLHRPTCPCQRDCGSSEWLWAKRLEPADVVTVLGRIAIGKEST